MIVFLLRKKNLLVAFMALLLLGSCQAQHQVFQGNTSVSYDEMMAKYEALDAQYDIASLQVIGQTDVGKPLHLFVINSSQNFDLDALGDEKLRILINNGIHPGEPCGIDASLLWLEEVLSGKVEKDLKGVVIGIIPAYNLGGMLNRGSSSRANQNGPEEYGFRGNARHLDLNRDFIKCDSENAKSFVSMYQAFQPHVFLDTHTSNGADYQYIITLIHSQEDKAGGIVGKYQTEQMNPVLYKEMEKRGYPMVPYVYSMGRTPESGIKNFMETPRYSTGYTAQFQSLGFVSETHMFKPYEERVESSYQFIDCLVDYGIENNQAIRTMRSTARKAMMDQTRFALQWELDTTRVDSLSFNGFEAIFEESKLNGQERLRYDRAQPFTRNIPYFERYNTSVEVEVPKYYVLPQAWKEVVQRLQNNGVEMQRLKNDTSMQVEVYYIKNLKTSGQPYEGHFVHSQVEVEKYEDQIDFYKGDWLIPVQQTAKRFVIETLEPQGVDSYFAWGFFDSVLQQKEWFSDYIFEEVALEMLETDPELKAMFDKELQARPDLEGNRWGQLYWLYTHSDYFEDSYNRYPVFRLD